MLAPDNQATGLLFIHNTIRRRIDAHCAGCSADGGCSPKDLCSLRPVCHDNGKPGVRHDYGSDYYAAFVVDLDGYRPEAYCNKKD
jgi:hypothetical protein